MENFIEKDKDLFNYAMRETRSYANLAQNR